MLFYDPRRPIDAEYFRGSAKYRGRNVPAPADVPAPEQPVSFLTRCMNRLHDLRVTLPRNLVDNADYGPLEFVLLDYGSTDGLGDWVREEMTPHLESGRLAYYRLEAAVFRPNHSQNVTFRVARNRLVANVDCDNFTHRGYARRLSQCAALAPARLLMVPDDFLLPGSRRLRLRGRFAAYRDDVEALGGFDEDLDDGFSHDDLSFVLRAALDGFTFVGFERSFVAGRLPTTDADRVALVKDKDYFGVRDRNARTTWQKLARGTVTANRGRHWGEAVLVRNFKDPVCV